MGNPKGRAHPLPLYKGVPMGGIKHTIGEILWLTFSSSLSLYLVTMAPCQGCVIEAHMQYAVALQGFLAEYQLPHSRRDRGAGGLIVHRICTKPRGAKLGALKCREPELLHDEDQEGARGDLRGALRP